MLTNYGQNIMKLRCADQIIQQVLHGSRPELGLGDTVDGGVSLSVRHRLGGHVHADYLVRTGQR